MNGHPTEKLSEYIDGDLTAAERDRVERHLSSCSQCAGLVEDLRAVVRGAQSVHDAPPAADLWPGIASRLEPRDSAPRVVAIESRRGPRRLSFSIPQLAAASLAVALLSAGAVWMAIRDGGTAGPATVAVGARSEEPITGAREYTGSEEPISWVTIVGIAILGIVAEWIEFMMSGKYARKYGGSRRAGWGAMLGGMVGAFMGFPVPIVGPVIGAFIGSFVGALAGELSVGSTGAASTRAATGALIGRALATAMKIGVGVAIAAWIFMAAI